MNETQIKNQIVNYEEFMKNNNFIELRKESIISTVKQYLRKGAVKPSLKPMVIIMSDIHLGAIRSEPELFEDFFTKMFDNEIPRYDFSELKALIFLGDFFDYAQIHWKILLINKKIFLN